MGDKNYQHRYIKHISDVQESNAVPSILMYDDVVGKIDFDYSTRHPRDYVVSGPIDGRGGGPGRVFLSGDDAERWAREFYGARFKHRIRESEKGGRWAILVAPMNG